MNSREKMNFVQIENKEFPEKIEEISPEDFQEMMDQIPVFKEMLKERKAQLEELRKEPEKNSLEIENLKIEIEELEEEISAREELM